MQKCSVENLQNLQELPELKSLFNLVHCKNPKVFCKKDFLKNLQNSNEKTELESLFNLVHWKRSRSSCPKVFCKNVLTECTSIQTNYNLKFWIHLILKGTLKQIWKSADIFVFIWKLYAEDFTLNTFYFLRYAHVRYVKSLFTNIQKQNNIIEISLLFKKFTNFTSK